MPISWNEIRHNAIRFSRDWTGAKSERAEKQTFWNEFFEVFGVSRRAVASFEEPVKKISGDYGYIDLFWPRIVLVEHKSAGKDLGKAEPQAFRYIRIWRAKAGTRKFPVTSSFQILTASPCTTSNRKTKKVCRCSTIAASPPSNFRWLNFTNPLCNWCWQRSACPREFSFKPQDHEILFGTIPFGSRVGQQLLRQARSWIEATQSYDKNQLGLSQIFLNSLRLTWIMCLDRLADEFPDHIRPAARRMHAWPMLMHRHTNNRRRFQQLAQRLELGADYPTDASEGARFRPDTPLVRYLDPLIYRLHATCQVNRDIKFKSVKDEQRVLYMTWWTRPEERPNEDVLAVIRAARLLPPLTKATAAEWAEKAIVPLILATDACDYKNCTEPALQTIGKQKGVKSLATFKSRLLAAVTATLRRLARATNSPL